MVLVYLIIFIPIAYLLIKWWVKLVNFLFKGVINQKPKKQSNPYIKAHKLKDLNDKYYEEYLNWLDKKGGDIPFDKVKSKEEERFERQWKQ